MISRLGAAFLDLAAARLKDDRLHRAAERFRNVSRLAERIGEVGGQLDLEQEVELEEASVAADLDPTPLPTLGERVPPTPEGGS